MEPKAENNERRTLFLTLLLVLLPLVGIVYSLNLASYVGFAFWQEQVCLVVLGLALGAGFMTGAAKSRGRFWHHANHVFAALALVICARAAILYPDLLAIGYLGTGSAYLLNLGSALVVFVMLIELLRRFAGWPMVILVLVFIGYALFADSFPGVFSGKRSDPDFLAGFLFLDSGGILGVALSVVVTTVIAYILLGAALFRMGGGDLFIDLALSSMGRFRGGAAKASVISSSLFGTISGSAVANVMADGIITIPLMKRSGFTPIHAAAVEATASTGGQLLPPVMGAAAFIMADYLKISYADVALAALIPALLYYFAVFMQIHFVSVRAGMRPLRADERPGFVTTIRNHWLFFIPIVILVYGLFFAHWQPDEAALVSTAALVIIGGFRMGWRELPRAILDTLTETGKGLLDIVVITAAAGLVIGILSITGLSFSIGLGIIGIAGSDTFVLLCLAALTAIIFGMGMPTTAVYILMATLLAPALIKAGIEPIAAHLFVLYYGVLSMITPPVCMASFAAASLAKAPFMRSGWQSMRYGAVAFILPFLFVTTPSLLLQSSDTLQTVIDIAVAVVGCVLLGAGIEGQLLSRLNAAQRVLAGVAGLAVMFPHGNTITVAFAEFARPGGLLLGAFLLLWSWTTREDPAAANA